MKKNYLYFLLFFFSLTTMGHAPQSGSAFRFIENKNQWDTRVLFKSDILGGALFLEKNSFTYHLIDESVRHKLHTSKVSVNPDSLILKGHAFKVHFSGANPNPSVAGESSFPDYYNYYLGNDPAKWASHVLAYASVNYQELYPGIDLKIYSSENHLKYDFIILPGGNVSDITLNYTGLDKIFLSEGNLILKTSINHIVEEKPYAYQIINGKKVEVPCHYVLNGTELSYFFPRGYDRSQKLIIDPTLIFSTYSGSHSDNFGYTATFDSDGFLYSGSSAFGPLYPTTTGAYQTTFGGGTDYYQFGTDIAITKFDTTGTFRIYSTYLGGSRDELPHSLIVNSKDELFILGTTGSSNFPVTAGSFDNTFNGGVYAELPGIAVEYPFGSDIFISKLHPDGISLLASTYLGGTANDGLLVGPTANLRYNYADEVRGEIEVDNSDHIYIASCTRSADFPMIGNGFQQSYGGGNFDAIIVKLNDSLNTVLWSSYLGGALDDASYSLELDTLQNFYITGGTTSANFPTTTGVITPLQQGGRADGFITYVDQNGDSIIYSTYFGSSSYDQIYFVDLDRFNNVYIFGQTQAPGNTFVINAGFFEPNSGQVLSKITPQLDSIIWSTVFGNGSGRPNISPTAFVVDLCSKLYLSGWGGTPENNEFLFGITRPFDMFTTLGPNPVTDFFQPTTIDHEDFYLFVLEDDASAVHYASFFGGNQSREHVDGGTSRFDKKGKIYQAMCAGCGGNSDMPLYPPLGSASLPDLNESSNCNLGVFKMDFRLPVVVADFDAEPGCIGDTIFFTNKSLIKSATTYQWSFGDGGTSTDKDPWHIYSSGGTYQVTLILHDAATCNLADTLTKTLYISPITSVALTAFADQDTIYKGQSTTLHVLPSSGFTFSWEPSGSLNNSTIPNPIATPDTTTTYTVFASDPLLAKCSIQTKVKVVVIELVCDEPRIYIPNAFTPDGDGQNEHIYVRSNVIKEFFFTIYNRWGEKVFETSDQDVGWDGTYKGMKADPGVFVYYLEATCLDDQKFFKKGNITLIR